MAARVAAQGVSALADDEGADLAERPLRPDRLPGHRLLLGAEEEEGAEQPRRSRSRAPRTFDKLGIPLDEQKLLAGVAVDAVFDSVSVATTFKEKLAKLGIIFCSFSEAVQRASRAGREVPRHRSCRTRDNFFAALNSAVFTDGSFVYIPKGVRCPMELSTYFRINAEEHRPVRAHADHRRRRARTSATSKAAPRRCATRTSCTPRSSSWSRIDDATIKYSTVQNWYPGDKEGKGGIYNFVTKRGDCRGRDSKISWTQVETGSAITWKYPGCILQGDNSVGEFYSVAMTNNYQQADTGTKMIHIGKNTRSTIVSKGISAGHGQNTYRGLVQDRQERRRRAQLLAVRLAADRRQVRRAHVPVHRGQEHLGARSSTRRRPRRSARTSSSTAGSAASRPKTRST